MGRGFLDMISYEFFKFQYKTIILTKTFSHFLMQLFINRYKRSFYYFNLLLFSFFMSQGISIVRNIILVTFFEVIPNWIFFENHNRFGEY